MDGWMGVLCLEISDFDINYVYTQAKYRQQSLSLYLSLSVTQKCQTLWNRQQSMDNVLYACFLTGRACAGVLISYKPLVEYPAKLKVNLWSIGNT